MKVFVIAMQKEAQPILDELTNKTERKVCGKPVYEGELFGKKTAVIVCGVGKVNAACGAQYAIDLLGADEIINIGVAGGLNGGVKVGEIYGISKAVQYDFDLTQLNGTAIGTLDECKENYLPLKGSRYPERKLATSDRFNDSKDDYKLLTEVLKADIRDMEGAAIAQVCMHAKVPCRAFKIISDLAGSGSTTEQYLSNLT
ncbi:MAG: 5'-methylthioadenosine/S-adenosylhomocysteine nucleosidase, partial [Clostridia bacterium]|nr:5'-methylthioadenosine/S-adenosylhomocysteine nucleosidase [Clostridia bacterium]